MHCNGAKRLRFANGGFYKLIASLKSLSYSSLHYADLYYICVSKKQIKMKNIKKLFVFAIALVVMASCEKEEKLFTINVICDTERGTVTGGGDYVEGETATITAIAKEGYFFCGWKETKEESSSFSFKVVGSRTITAHFGKIDESQFGTVKVSVTKFGDSLVYEAIPNDNCFFIDWSNDVSVIRRNTWTLKADSKPITANFIKLDNVNFEHGNLSMEITEEGVPMVVPVPDDDYYFWKWSDGTIADKVVERNKEYSFTPIFKPYPEGALHCVFYIDDNRRVIFSKGNLQFNPTLGTHTRADGTVAPGTWRFAEKQYERIDSDSVVSASYDGWIERFAWGTSGWAGSGAKYYQPYDGIYYDIYYSNDSFASLFGPQGINELTGDYAYADWGVYNPISNGGNKPGMWRTLTRDEYVFLIRRRQQNWYSFKERYGGITSNFMLFSDYKRYKEIDKRCGVLVDDYNHNYCIEDCFEQLPIELKELFNKYSLFLCTYLGWEYWTASSSSSNNIRAITNHVVIGGFPNDPIFEYPRNIRHPVRLVMDLDE